MPLVLRHFTFEHGANMPLEYRSNVALHVLVQNMFGLARDLEELDVQNIQRPRADLNRDRWIQSPEC
jgi:hypothetical protein